MAGTGEGTMKLRRSALALALFVGCRCARRGSAKAGAASRGDHAACPVDYFDMTLAELRTRAAGGDI